MQDPERQGFGIKSNCAMGFIRDYAQKWANSVTNRTNGTQALAPFCVLLRVFADKDRVLMVAISLKSVV